jgi:hypothetical protein
MDALARGLRNAAALKVSKGSPDTRMKSPQQNCTQLVAVACLCSLKLRNAAALKVSRVQCCASGTLAAAW